MTLIAFILAMAMQPNPCETIGPRLDGTYVTICAGKVTHVTDVAPRGPYTYLRPESR